MKEAPGICVELGKGIVALVETSLFIYTSMPLQNRCFGYFGIVWYNLYPIEFSPGSLPKSETSSKMDV